MLGLARRWLWFVSLWALSGCVLSEISFEGRACPCTDGYVCVQNVCVPAGSAPDATAPPDASGGADASVDSGVGEDAEPVDASDAMPAPDAEVDAGEPMDAEPGDAEPMDAEPMDAEPMDADPPDLGPGDSGVNVPCFTDRECAAPSTICVGGLCQLGCNNGGPACAGGLACDTTTGHCFNATAACVTDADCGSGPPVGVCVDSQCRYGCSVSTVAACTGDRLCETTGFCRVAPNCTVTADCGRPDFACQAGNCVRRCDEPGAFSCLGNSTCDTATGLCQGAAPVGQNCVNNADCITNNCLNITTPNPQTFCSRACGATSDCPLDTSCLAVNGSKLCVRENVFSPQPQMDTPSGGNCANPGNVCQSLLCSGGGTCTERCTVDEHCAAFGNQCFIEVISGGGGTTFIQQCGPPVGAGAPGDVCPNDDNNLCQSGICNRYRNRCAAGCCSDADCDAAESCLAYDLNQRTGSDPATICQPRSGAGTNGLGTSCASAADCLTDNCAPRDPSNLGGAKSCTTHCCTDLDCAGYPGGARCAPMPALNVAGLVNYCVPLSP